MRIRKQEGREQRVKREKQKVWGSCCALGRDDDNDNDDHYVRDNEGSNKKRKKIMSRAQNNIYWNILKNDNSAGEYV